MGLKQLVGALLPIQAREHILGDLEERGFGLRDLASTIPAAWVSHLRREWTGPVPSLAATSQETLEARTRYLLSVVRHRGCLLFAALLTRVVVKWLHVPLEPMTLGVVLFGLFRWLLPLEPFKATWLRKVPDPVQRYRMVLGRATNSFLSLVITWKTATDLIPVTGGNQAVVWGGTVVLMVAGIRRYLRLSRELKMLPPSSRNS